MMEVGTGGNLTGNHDCVPPTECPHIHIRCGLAFNTLEELDVFIAGVRRATGSEMAALLRRAPRSVSFNAARQAVQVRGCEGSLIANVPLRADQLADLATD